MNFYTAKRLLTALGMTIQRHEGMFGSIELDVRRRQVVVERSPLTVRRRLPAGSVRKELSSKPSVIPIRKCARDRNGWPVA